MPIRVFTPSYPKIAILVLDQNAPDLANFLSTRSRLHDDATHASNRFVP